MVQTSDEIDPDWDTPLTLRLTPAGIFHTLLATAGSVHTGWDSCVDPAVTVWEMTTLDDAGENHCRLVEQEYADEHEREVVWHDWTVELRLGEVYVAGHWRSHAGAGIDWDWCSAEAEKAFVGACSLLGRRVRKGLVIEEPTDVAPAPSTRH